MPTIVTKRIAIVGEDGRLPDSTTPAQVFAILTQMQQILDGIEAHLQEMLAKSANLSDIPSPAAARQNLGAAPIVHTHQQGDILGLVDVLGAKADLVNGVIPTSQIPREAMGDPVVVEDEAEMLALTAEQVQPGDIAIRQDGQGSFILKNSDPSVLGSWVRLNSPTDAVTSVNGQIGDVALGAADVGAVSPGQLSTAINGVQIEADGFAELAAGSAAAASGSATAAAGSALLAGQARTGAETARSGAEAALAAVPDAVTDQVTAQVAPQVTAAQTARTGAETARTGAEKARDETEQIYVLLGNVSGTKTLTLAEANKPTGWDATLTANTDFVLPSLGNRILTCSLYLVAGTAGVTYRVLGSKASYGQVLVHTGTLNAVDLVHLLHFGPRGWIVLAGAAALSVPTGWVS